jgi:hypothetical protein
MNTLRGLAKAWLLSSGPSVVPNLVNSRRRRNYRAWSGRRNGSDQGDDPARNSTDEQDLSAKTEVHVPTLKTYGTSLSCATSGDIESDTAIKRAFVARQPAKKGLFR